MTTQCNFHYPLHGLIFLAMCCAGMVRAQESSETADFFEAKIRPALIEYCLDCHAVASEASGGLLLDSKQGWQNGGDSGPAIVAGAPADSLLMRVISYDDPDLQMPPEGKLSDALILDFQQWIRLGAVDPRVVTSAAKKPKQTGLPVERAQEHWSYRPVSDVQTPADEGSSSVDRNAALPSGTAIDAFLNKQLHQIGIAREAIAPRASKEQLVRRLYFDLTGLPPTPEELSSFINDESAIAYSTLVDRLLASPRFGETFARHWMDVVRYADSVTLRGFVLPQAWRYRDYLVDAFSNDRSFATMIEEQIAGDQLSASDLQQRTQQLVATTFWAMGNTNLEQQDKSQLEMDYIDEQLEVMGRAFLGQTIGCARCHDHKFDPIPTQDYYALAGILRSTVAFQHDNVSKWIEEPLPLDDEATAEFDRLASEAKAIDDRLTTIKNRLKQSKKSPPKRNIPVEELAGIVVDSDQAKLVGTWVSSTFFSPMIGSSYLHDDNTAKGEKTATFAPEALPPGNYQVRFAYTPGSNRPSALEVKVFSADGEKSIVIDQRKTPPEDGLWVSLGKFRFEDRGQAYVLISNANTDGTVIVDAVQYLPIDTSDTSPSVTASDQANKAQHTLQSKTAVSLAEETKELETRRKVIEAKLAQRPRYLTIRETNQAQDIPIHIRGDVHNLGRVVPRGFLTALNYSSVDFPSNSSGRLELARWIATADNPLTARVYANRVWSWLMGRGLVASENNFGTTGMPPTHPELLDWLALQLVESNWSTKELVRTIVLSDAYQRSIIEGDSRTLQIDPDNVFYWRGHSRRVRVESLRDAMLLVSGELDLAVGDSLIPPNLTADYNYQHSSTRRSIYHPVFRNSLPALFEAFDFANASVSVGRRSRSTVAPQALALMNHPWVSSRADAAANRLYDSLGPDSDVLVRACYVACFSREPTEEELQTCREFLDESDASSKERLAQLIQTLFASIDFRFLE